MLGKQLLSHFLIDSIGMMVKHYCPYQNLLYAIYGFVPYSQPEKDGA